MKSEHERKLDELGEFAVKYRNFIVGFEQSASPPSSGKKVTYGKSKVKNRKTTSKTCKYAHLNPAWDSAVSRRNSRAHVPYCNDSNYTCDVIGTSEEFWLF
ncbi:hypothetical protein SPRG_16611 [Saprolegnia parasitica CBS 223.65]|uniref:Uncharacterized protein n=1 Tax=Saprolegnia parasitica (strain CBS 223.65) TaxID=695850 RepID=A0A067BIH0_SAPPC|nr:hypothetical protein SPRG_16611 [Saprolegnia parasitica CBS 223.65]KDO17978.1 hypothetical protein SPRG_16611 [Saprolegnia parasitica CBS 223.65]|eukprot:XP_012211307.1 hypothetical protein SPRG_16611 [Saprolegnia parasitica CBS 223.65]